MGLDYIMEVDSELSEEDIFCSLEKSGWHDISESNGEISAYSDGFAFYYNRKNPPEKIVCEDNREIQFDVKSDIYIRKKGPASDAPLEGFLNALVQRTDSLFLVSFQLSLIHI